MKNYKSKFGKKGEDLAFNFFLSRGYQVLETNWRKGKYEVDLIVTKGEFIVFIEVKHRKSGEFGEAPDFVSNAQQKRIMNAAHDYITEKDIDLEARFDIIAIIQEPEPRIEHIEEAFYPTL